MRTNLSTFAVFKGSVGIAGGALLFLMAGAGDVFNVGFTGIGQVVETVPFDAPAFWMFFASLFAIMNPIVAVPYFVSLTEDGSEAQRQRLALLVTVAVLVSLVAAALFGREILSFFAISVSSFRIAGGVIVFLMGLSLLNAKLTSNCDAPAPTDRPVSRASEAICPLAFPLLVGPGSIATIILRSESAKSLGDFVIIGAVILSMVTITYLVLRAARPLARMVGQSGLTVLTRLIGMIVAAIAVDMVVIGVRAIVPGAGT